jgi:hypothetical protein
MKGIVFTEFLEMVENCYSADMVDDIIDASQLASGGIYTAVATYPHQEMVALMLALCERTGNTVQEELRAFGRYLFGRFFQLYPHFFKDVPDAFTFLSGIEGIIHAQVLKLYPDAELPRFHIEEHDAQHLTMRYESIRHFEDLAEGLIAGCVETFGEQITIRRETLGSGDSRQERFILARL